MDHAGFQAWLDGYIRAWRSNDAEVIASLFTDDARYSFHPYDQDVVGRDAIVAAWLDSPDDPATWEAHYEPWAIEGDRGVAVGWSHYFDPGASHDTPRDQYANVYLVTFAPDGRAREFRESWMQSREGFQKRLDRAAAEAVERAQGVAPAPDQG